MIVALLAEKGGTGKTTLATNLAGMRSRNRRVLLIDADRQGSSHFWAQQRARVSVFKLDSETLHGESFARRLRNLVPRYDDVIIDTGAGDNIEQEAALAAADCAIAPVQPSGVDVATMGLVDSRVAHALELTPGLRAWALLNRVSPNSRNRDEAEARAALSGCTAIRVADIRLCDRVAFPRALTAGLIVWEYRVGAAKAHEEIEAVYELVFDETWRT